MKYLLDTHAFIWMDSDPNQLSELARSLIQDPSNILLLSVVSIWEMQIKSQLGKLLLTLPLAELVESQRQSNSIEILPITLSHVLALENLPLHHKDPFARMLIAQANVENALVVSADPVFVNYQVQVIW